MSLVLPGLLLQPLLVGPHLDGLVDEAGSLCVIVPSYTKLGVHPLKVDSLLS